MSVTAPYARNARQFIRQAKKLKKSALAGAVPCQAASGGANQNIISTGVYRAAAKASADRKASERSTSSAGRRPVSIHPASAPSSASVVAASTSPRQAK